MTTNIRCDICNKNLDFNETKLKKNMLSMGAPKLGSKYIVATEFEGAINRMEQCLSCAINIRNFIESEKIKARK